MAEASAKLRIKIVLARLKQKLAELMLEKRPRLANRSSQKEQQ
jgi:hypothetical protein